MVDYPVIRRQANTFGAVQGWQSELEEDVGLDRELGGEQQEKQT